MITRERLMQVLDYDSTKGVFRWKERESNTSYLVGRVAGCNEGKGYRAIRIDRRTYKAHRLAWLYVYGAMPRQQIDHINRRRDDNRIANLREASTRTNAFNSGRKTGKSGLRGVYFHPKTGKWKGRVCADRKEHYLGLFRTKEEAAAAVLTAAIKLHGEFCSHKPPERNPHR